MAEPTPMTDERRAELWEFVSRVEETGFPAGYLRELLTENDRLREAAYCGCGDGHTVDSLCPNCQAAHDVQPTDSAVDRIVLRQRDGFLVENTQLRRVLREHVMDWGDCTPDPDINPRCVCSHARAERILAGEPEW